MPLTIRPPTAEEFQNTASFFEREFYSQTVYATSIPFDSNTAISLGNLSLSQNLFYVAVDANNALAGGIMGISSPFLFNANVQVASEVFFYIAPEHRKGRLAIQLVNRLEYQCRIQNVKLLTMASLATHKSESVQKLYEHLGFQPSECFHCKML